MSFGYASPRQTVSKTLDTPAPAYVRPSEWIELAAVGPTDQKFSGLYAVYPNNEDNYVALTGTVSSGNYTVDWGDGTVENIASGTQANHQYTYTSLSNLTSYGYKQAIITVTPQTANLTGISIAKRPNYSGAVGAAVQWPAKWLDIEVGSPNLTSLVIGQNSTFIGLPLLQRVRWASKASSYTTQGDFFYWCVALQSVIFDANMSNWTNMNAMFYNCQALVYAPYFDTSAVTDMGNCFANCYNLINVPNYKTSALITLNGAFLNCYRLRSVGFTSTANVTTFNSTFQNCYDLTNIPTLDFTKVTIAQSAFANIRNLNSINIINAGNCNNYIAFANGITNLSSVNISGTIVVGNINYSQAFSGCINLSQISLPNTANVTNLSATFNNCSSLTSMPVTYTPNVTTFNQAFANCINLKAVSNVNTSNATNMASMFQNLILISDAPNLDTSKVTTVQSMYSGCLNLRGLPAYNLANIASGGGQILGGGGTALGTSAPITTSNVTGVKFSIAYNQTNMNAASLTTMMNNLGSNGAGQTLNITGNPGVDTVVAKTATWSNVSNVMTMANTVGIAVGTQITGGFINGNIAYTLSAQKLNTAAYLDNGIQVASLTGQPGMPANTIYYTSNRAGSGPYTYDLSLVNGGTPNNIGSAGSGNFQVNLLVTAVNTNANVILNAFPSGGGTATTANTRALNTTIATLKGWTVTG